jgi:hypothetical protein
MPPAPPSYSCVVRWTVEDIVATYARTGAFRGRARTDCMHPELHGAPLALPLDGLARQAGRHVPDVVGIGAVAPT